MRVLVMGGTGEVGHQIANGLLARGHDVMVLTRGRDRRGFPLDERIRRVQADKNHLDALAAAAAPWAPEVIIDTLPDETSVRNVHTLFAGKMRHYLHCSSTGVYTPLQYLPADEAHPWDPKPGDFYVPCGARDRLALALCREDGFPATILRPTMIIGPGALPVDNLGGRSATFLRDLAAHRPLELPEDGDALVQGVCNADLAEAFILAVEQPEQAIGEIFNISCARAITLRDYIGLFKEALGSQSPLVPTPIETLLTAHAEDGRADEYWLPFLCQHMCFDISKARERLHYHPAHDLRASVRLVTAWAAQTERF